MQILRLRILPPMAIARFGSSPSPMDNYDLRLPVDPEGRPSTGFREIVPAETLVIDEEDGSIHSVAVPDAVRFRDALGRVRPVSPFLEVFAEFAGSDTLEPLTLAHLDALGLTPQDIKWRAIAGNLKAFRRTGDPGDRVTATTGLFSDHARQPLVGIAANFKAGKTIPFGTVRYIRPTAAHPEIRARFTPEAGRVYGPRSNDPLVTDDVYAGRTADNVGQGGLAPRGGWDRYYIGDPGGRPATAPGDIFQGEDIGTNRANGSKLSHGYFDDSCDGLLEVSLTVDGRRLAAHARFASAVPDFAPDCLPVRSIADDVEQMALGPDVPSPTGDDERTGLKRDIEDILRRGYETVRQMNTAVMNGDEPTADVPRYRNNMAGQETGYGRAFEPIFPTPEKRLEYLQIAAWHAGFLRNALEATSFENAFRGGMRVMRRPEQAGDLTSRRRRLMPALMRGNEGLELMLTRRQLSKLALADPLAGPREVLSEPEEVAEQPQLATGLLRRPLRSQPPEDR